MIAKIHVNLERIRENVRRLRALVAPARFAAVIKANAYGHGLGPVAAALGREVDLTCVYHPGEAFALRDAGFAGELLVLGPADVQLLPDLLAARCAITLWSTGSYRREAVRLARAAGTPLRAHVKVETGVGRFGFDPRMVPRALDDLLGDTAIALEGVFTHLAAAEELESAFTAQQGERFAAALRSHDEPLRERRVVRHAAASAAAMLYPVLRLDMVRCGIAIYGLWPSPQTRAAMADESLLQPALSWTSTLAVVREVAAGRPLGYGCTFETARDSRIGVIPIGYAEGVPRAAGNTGAVLVAGRRAPIVGRVCMNATLVDVTDIPQARPGAQVTLIGRDGSSELSADDWAAWTGTINYEIVTRLPLDVPREFSGL